MRQAERPQRTKPIGVPALDLVRDVEDLNLSGELAGLAQGGVLLVDHHVAGTRHVLLVQALDVETNVVTRVGSLGTRVMHLDREDLSRTRVGPGMRRQEYHILARLDDALLNASSKHITDALNLV